MVLKLVSGISLSSVVLLAFYAGKLDNRVAALEAEKKEALVVVQVVESIDKRLIRLEETTTLSQTTIQELKALLREHERETRRNIR